MELKKLTSPVQIAGLDLRNRIVMAPMGTRYADANGEVSDQLIAYYEARAIGGAGLIIIEITCVDGPSGLTIFNQLRADDDRFLPGLARLAGAIKRHGARVALQLQHGGRRAIDVSRRVGPSAVALLGRPAPRALSVEQIEALVERFADAAARARQAGFDAVELHAAHGYLVSDFLSPLTNHRSDEYGGDLLARTRFATEVVTRIKDRVGPDFPLSVRISGDELVRGGLGVEETSVVARRLQDAGADVIHVSAGWTVATLEEFAAQQIHPRPPAAFPRGCFVHLASRIKRATALPVIAVGRINHPCLAEEILVAGHADLVAMGRAFLADPQFPIKAADGDFDGIRKCIGCDEGCGYGYGFGKAHFSSYPLRCTVNAALGKERESSLQPARQVKQVLVAGGGPAGMEAARAAALRGHKVTVYEKTARLGGNLIAASAVSCKEEFRRELEYLAGQMTRLGIDLRMGVEVTPDVVRRARPDAVVLALGSTAWIPNIPGASLPMVTDAVRVLRGESEVGRSVVVVGGNMTACEAAAFLAEQGRKVSLVTARTPDRLAADMSSLQRRWFLVDFWPRLGISVCQAAFSEVAVGGLEVIAEGDKRQLIEAETVVFALGRKPNRELARLLEGMAPEIYTAGDCVKPNDLLQAIHQGWSVGRQI